MSAPKFTPGQPVTLNFTGPRDEPFTREAVIVENCDATCAPLTDMWLVQIVAESGQPGRTFGFSGKAITPREPSALDRVIAEERAARRPCPDLLAYLDGLRGKPDGVIAAALAELEGEAT